MAGVERVTWQGMGQEKRRQTAQDRSGRFGGSPGCRNRFQPILRRNPAHDGGWWPTNRWEHCR